MVVSQWLRWRSSYPLETLLTKRDHMHRYFPVSHSFYNGYSLWMSPKRLLCWGLGLQVVLLRGDWTMKMNFTTELNHWQIRRWWGYWEMMEQGNGAWFEEVCLWLGWACQAEPVKWACILFSDPWWATLLYHVLPTWCSALSMLPRSITVSDHGLKPWNKISLTSSLFFFWDRVSK